MPDTVELNGGKIKVTATQNDGGTVGLSANRIDKTEIAGFTNNPVRNYCSLYANPGSLTANETFLLKVLNGKMFGTFYIIPQQKGVYFFEQNQQGYVD